MGLYLRPDSPFWWYSFAIRNRRVRRCTYTTRFDMAQKIYQALRSQAALLAALDQMTAESEQPKRNTTRRKR
jgi:hypothetical protein